MENLLEQIKEAYSKNEFYNTIAEEGIIMAILDYISLTLLLIITTIIPIVPIYIINEKSKEKFKSYKCTGEYKEDKKICKECKYKEECKNGS